jgi:hypothetical protein
MNYETVIKGTVRLKGTPPAETTFDVAGSCSANVDQPLITHFFVTDAKRGLADTIVFIAKPPPYGFHLAGGVTNVLMFTNCEIQPSLNTWTYGQALSVTEGSGLSHDLRIRTGSGTTLMVRPVTENERFLLSPKLSPDFLTFTCDLHPWESGFVAVFSHPFFAVTDEHGEFTITNVSPGTYTLQAMHRDGPSRRSSTSQEIRVRQRQKVSADFDFPSPSK